MSMTIRIRAALAAWALLAPVVCAAAPASGAAVSPGLGGPVVPGVCLLSREAVLTRSKVGLAAATRLQQLTKTAQGELENERLALERDAKALDAQRTGLPATQFEQRRQALAQRAQALQAKVQTDGRQVEATRGKIVARILQEAQPVVAEIYQARGCGLIASREAILGGNMANDLTPAVVEALDAKIGAIDFDLEPAAAPTTSR